MRSLAIGVSETASSTVQNTVAMLADVQTLIQDLEQKNKALQNKMVRAEDVLLSKLFSVNDAHLMHVCFRIWCDALAEAKESACFASIEALIAEDSINYDQILQQLQEELMQLVETRSDKATLELRLRDAEATIESLGEVLGRCAYFCNKYPNPCPEPPNEESHKLCRRELGVALLEMDRGLGSGNSTLVATVPMQAMKTGGVAASPGAANFRPGTISPYTPQRMASGSWPVTQGNPTPVQMVCQSPPMPVNPTSYTYTT